MGDLAKKKKPSLDNFASFLNQNVSSQSQFLELINTAYKLHIGLWFNLYFNQKKYNWQVLLHLVIGHKKQMVMKARWDYVSTLQYWNLILIVNITRYMSAKLQTSWNNVAETCCQCSWICFTQKYGHTLLVETCFGMSLKIIMYESKSLIHDVLVPKLRTVYLKAPKVTLSSYASTEVPIASPKCCPCTDGSA